MAKKFEKLIRKNNREPFVEFIQIKSAQNERKQGIRNLKKNWNRFWRRSGTSVASVLDPECPGFNENLGKIDISNPACLGRPGCPDRASKIPSDPELAAQGTIFSPRNPMVWGAGRRCRRAFRFFWNLRLKRMKNIYKFGCGPGTVALARSGFRAQIWIQTLTMNYCRRTVHPCPALCPRVKSQNYVAIFMRRFCHFFKDFLMGSFLK